MTGRQRGLIAAVVMLVLLAAGALLTQMRTAELPGVSSLLPRSEVTGAVPADSALILPRGIAGWFNTPGNAPLGAQDLAGKVVLVDFWTYSCINCIRTLPYLTDWHAKYADKGLVILGVHTPEFAFEKEAGNVRRALQKYGITYPVAQDNDFATWDAYGNRYWPAKYLFDADGKLVYTHFGEGEYDVTENKIRALLAAAGATIDMPMAEEIAGPDFSRIGSPETYLGYERGTRFGTAVVPDEQRTYAAPPSAVLNRAYLDGAWTVQDERSVLAEAGGRIVYRFRAAKVHLVMGAPAPVRVRLRLDGALIGEITVSAKDLYTLVDKDGYAEGLLEIEFLDPGVEVYAFTFG